MSHPIQPLPARHEVDLQARRFERKTEDFRLAKLKARLLAKVHPQKQQPSLMPRAS